MYMDDAICFHNLRNGIGTEYPRFVAENGIQFYKPIEFAYSVDVGIRVTTLGKSSVTYDVGFFAAAAASSDDEDSASHPSNELRAEGKFVHVYVNPETGRPNPIPDFVRSTLKELMVEKEDD